MLSRRNVNLKMLYWSSKNLSVSQPEFPVKREMKSLQYPNHRKQREFIFSQGWKLLKNNYNVVHAITVKSINTYDSIHVRRTSPFKKDLGFPKGIYIYNSYSPIYIRYY